MIEKDRCVFMLVLILDVIEILLSLVSIVGNCVYILFFFKDFCVIEDEFGCFLNCEFLMFFVLVFFKLLWRYFFSVLYRI